jgi:hypothetical protein
MLNPRPHHLATPSAPARVVRVVPTSLAGIGRKVAAIGPSLATGTAWQAAVLGEQAEGRCFFYSKDMTREVLPT